MSKHGPTSTPHEAAVSGHYETEFTTLVRSIPSGRAQLTLPAPNNWADNLIVTNDAKFRQRARTLLSNSLTKDVLRAQYALINGHARYDCTIDCKVHDSIV